MGLETIGIFLSDLRTRIVLVHVKITEHDLIRFDGFWRCKMSLAMYHYSLILIVVTFQSESKFLFKNALSNLSPKDLYIYSFIIYINLDKKI